jgi:hypothetical protein
LLVAMCCVVAPAAAFDLAPSAPADVSESSSTISLPAFLDADRVPDFQEAWRTLSSPLRQEEERAPAFVPPLELGEAPAARAKEELPATAPSQHAETVRLRAEALSRKFFSGNASSDKPAARVAAPATAPESASPVRPAPAATIETAKSSDPMPPPYGIGADPSADRGEIDAAAHPDASDTTTAALPDAHGIDRRAPSATGAAALHAVLPPLPQRRPEAVATASREEQETAPMRRVRTYVSPAPRGPRVNDAKREVFPHYMQSFGWNSKP